MRAVDGAGSWHSGAKQGNTMNGGSRAAPEATPGTVAGAIAGELTESALALPGDCSTKKQDMGIYVKECSSGN